MDTALSEWERHLLSEHRLRERAWELRLAVGGTGLIGVVCVGGLVAVWCGVEIAEFTWDLLWIGAVGGIGGAVSAWREWRHITLLRKLMQRVSELEAQAEDAARDEPDAP